MYICVFRLPPKWAPRACLPIRSSETVGSRGDAAAANQVSGAASARIWVQNHRTDGIRRLSAARRQAVCSCWTTIGPVRFTRILPKTLPA